MSTSKIEFNSFQIKEVNLVAPNNFDEGVFDGAHTHLQYGTHRVEDSPHSYVLIMEVKMEVSPAEADDKQSFPLRVSCAGLFSSTEEITEEFMQSSFVKISSPAILFPYLRAFVTTLTANAGYGPLVLPTFNFVAMAQEQSQSRQ